MYGMKEGEAYKPWLWPVPEGGVIGKYGLGRKDGYSKACGKARFPRDNYNPGELYAKPFLSPYPHAKIKNMDTSQAEALPGVRAVLRYDDADIDWPTCSVARSLPFTYKLIGDYARWYGQPVGAMVVADTELIVDEALRLIEIEWEVLPFFIDWNESLESDTILFPDVNADNNVRRELVEEFGDVEQGLEEAPNVIDVRFDVEVDTWGGVAGNCTRVDWRGPETLEIWYEGQGWTPFEWTPNWILGSKKYLPANQLLALSHVPYLPGRFGQGFQYETNFSCFALTAAQKVGSPVKLLFDTSTFCGSGEHAGTYYLTIGFKNNGEITAVKYHLIEASSCQDQLEKIHKGSKIHNLQMTKTYSMNNRGYYTCYRHGAPGVSCHTEAINQVAAALGMDPTEVSLINDGSYGQDMEWIKENVKAVEGFDATRDSLKEVLAIGKEAIDWDNKWHQPGTKLLANGNYHGIGFTSTIGWATEAGALAIGSFGLKIQFDGTVNIICQDTDLGINRETIYSQVVADELGVKYESVHYSEQEFDGFEACMPAASAGLVGNLPALVRICKKMKELVFEKAVQPRVIYGHSLPAFFPDSQPEDLDMLDGEVFVKTAPETRVPLADIASSFNRELFTWDYPTNSDTTDITPKYNMVRQCWFMEVEVDPDTGKVHIEKVVAVNDVGRIINPDTLEGQQYGGAYMGIGRANTLQVIWDPQTGVKLNDNLIQYPIALYNDCTSVDCHLVETGLSWASYGACGIGESPAACVASLTRYAVYNAIGKWVNLKTTPEKILKALGKA
jgi:CO/xanthine dehydrogenase Mo-binding subunit